MVLRFIRLRESQADCLNQVASVMSSGQRLGDLALDRERCSRILKISPQDEDRRKTLKEMFAAQVHLIARFVFSEHQTFLTAAERFVT
jgi:hypothetical protein